MNRPEDAYSPVEVFFEQLASLDKEDGGCADKIPAKMKDFAAERVTGVLGSIEEIDAKLEGILVEAWSLSRLGTVERAVLRMGIWEMDNTDVPPAVVINEAVDLVNWFSSPRSRSLVNGVLDKYSKSR